MATRMRSPGPMTAWRRQQALRSDSAGRFSWRILSWLALWEISCTVSATFVTSSTCHVRTQGMQVRRAQDCEKKRVSNLTKKCGSWTTRRKAQDDFERDRNYEHSCTFFDRHSRWQGIFKQLSSFSSFYWIDNNVSTRKLGPSSG